MEKIIVIRFNEGGDPPFIEEIEEREFLARLDKGHYGKNPNFAERAEIDTARFVGLLVIRGRVVSHGIEKCGEMVTVLHELHDFICERPKGHADSHRAEERAYDEENLKKHLHDPVAPGRKIMVTWE